MSLIKPLTPRPKPKFFPERQIFSTKKERCTPRHNPPPRPPGKSCPPISRVFSYRPSRRAKLVSFKDSDSSLTLQNKYYDETSNLSYFEQCFEIVCKLGSGSFADVFKARYKVDGKYYAIKRSKDKFKGKYDRKRKLEEVQKHEHLPKHANCIEFCKAWEEKEYLYIQTELCKMSLSQYAEKNNFPEHDLWNYLVDLLLALKHLHDHNLVHLDIKPDNIFISEQGICKLGDFGLVLDLSKGDISEAIEGDPRYLAAELMEGRFSKPADIFSLGVTILELACDLFLPNGGDLWHQLRNGSIPRYLLSRVSPELANMICLMMEPDPNKRLTVDQLLEIPAVCEVLQRRKVSVRMKSVFSYVVMLCRGFWYCLCCLKTVVCYPYNRLTYKEKTNTPVRSERLPSSGYEFSFSDDDVFEKDEFRLLKTPMSSLGDSMNDSLSTISQPRFPGRGAVSTPGAMCYFLNRSIPDPCCSPTLEWRRNSPHMNSSPISRLQSPESSARQDALSGSHLINIEPKNLMEAFDAESDED